MGTLGFHRFEGGEKVLNIRLVIGGYAQGKLNYVLKNYHLCEESVWDCSLTENTFPAQDTIILYHFHDWIRKEFTDGNLSVDAQMQAFAEKYENCIIICDEVLNGIVPMDALDREYQNQLGRRLIELAKKAETVERVICGIGQKIK